MIRTNGIGGYFEFPLPQYDHFYHNEAYRFQSARAAFRALLQVVKPRKLWMPNYTCNALLEPVEAEGINCSYYNSDFKLGIKDNITLEEGDFLVFINYFGLCESKVEEVLSMFPLNKVILDCSQAFFANKMEVLATIYSPRKFFSVPDGGMLDTKLDVPMPEQQDDSSIDRVKYLLERASTSPEEGYADYIWAENSLENSTPLRMSKLTERLLRSLDFEAIQTRRMENYSFLDKKLSNINKLDISSVTAPLCYPFCTDNDKLKETLIKHRIFVPTYWQDAVKRVGEVWEKKMINNLLPLPIDQRYGLSEMELISNLILEYSDE